ncbi:MAG: hypothetical protein IPM13_13915 [Phycisphaerales bacterium]|nr:hypothetical protein [Phycisphaerales bacterium]
MSTATFSNVWADTFRQVADNYTKTFQAGMKFYEDTAKLYADLAAKGAEEGRARVEKTIADMGDLNRKNFERFQAFFEEQTRRNASLTPYMLDPTCMSNPAEACERVAAMWRTSFETLRDSVATAAKATAELIDGYSQVYRSEAGKK